MAASQILPLRNWGGNRGFGIRGRPPVNESTTFRVVTANYFQTMGIPVVSGRAFEPGDGEGERVTIINQALADRFFPGEDPVGQYLQSFDLEGERIVGVVGNALEAGLINEAVPARYMLYEHAWVPSGMSFVVRSDDPDRIATVLDSARSTVAGTGGGFAVDGTTTMREIFDRAMGPTGQIVTLVSLLGGLALVLGGIGVYGVIWHDVLRRSREYGIRMALGETPSRVLGQVVGRGATLVALGSAIGVGAALVLTRLLSSLLYGVEPTDAVAMSAAVVILMLVGVLAAFLPARRASRTDPAAVLRDA